MAPAMRSATPLNPSQWEDRANALEVTAAMTLLGAALIMVMTMRWPSSA